MKIYEVTFDLIYTYEYGEDTEKLVKAYIDLEDKWRGLKGKELKEALEYDDIGEIDGLETPEVILQYNKEHRNFNVLMENVNNGKYIMVGETPREFTTTILYYLSYDMITSCYVSGGKYKALGMYDNEVKEYTKPIDLTLTLSFYAK